MTGRRIDISEPEARELEAFRTVTGLHGALRRSKAPGLVCHANTCDAGNGRVLFHEKVVRATG